VVKPQSWATLLLLVFVGLSVAYLVAKEASQAEPTDDPQNETTGSPATQPTATGPSQAPTSQAAVSRQIVATYFRANARCPSCVKIEAYTTEAVEQGFADALTQGRLVWRVVNVDEPGNKHYVRDYELYTKSVVLAEFRDGKQVRWKNLKKVWELLHSKDAFVKYVDGEVRAFLGDR